MTEKASRCEVCGGAIPSEGMVRISCPECSDGFEVMRAFVADAVKERGVYTFVCEKWGCYRLWALPASIWCPGCGVNLRHDYATHLQAYNREHPPKGMVFDPGTCAGCGRTGPNMLAMDEALICPHCRRSVNVPQSRLRKDSVTRVQCARCSRPFDVPPTVWCQVCGKNMRTEQEVRAEVYRHNKALSAPGA